MASTNGTQTQVPSSVTQTDPTGSAVYAAVNIMGALLGGNEDGTAGGPAGVWATVG